MNPYLPCLLKQASLITLAEIAAFKVFYSLLYTYELSGHWPTALAIFSLIVGLAVLGLVDETLLTVILLVSVFFLLPGLEACLAFFRDNVSLVLIQAWLPLFFCRHATELSDKQ